MERLRPPVQSDNTLGASLSSMLGQKGWYHTRRLSTRFSRSRNSGQIRTRQDAAVPQRPRTVLHAPLKPHHDRARRSSSSATRHARFWHGLRREPGIAERRLNLGDVVTRSQVELSEIEVDRLVLLATPPRARPQQRGRHRPCAERRRGPPPPAAAGRAAWPSRSTRRRPPARDAGIPSDERHRARARRRCAPRRAARDRRTARSRNRQWTAPARARSARPRRRRLDDRRLARE